MDHTTARERERQNMYIFVPVSKLLAGHSTHHSPLPNTVCFLYFDLDVGPRSMDITHKTTAPLGYLESRQLEQLCTETDYLLGPL